MKCASSLGADQATALFLIFASSGLPFVSTARYAATFALQSAVDLNTARLFYQLAVKRLGYYGAEVARYLGITTSAVNRNANSEELLEVKNYL